MLDTSKDASLRQSMRDLLALDYIFLAKHLHGVDATGPKQTNLRGNAICMGIRTTEEYTNAD